MPKFLCPLWFRYWVTMICHSSVAAVFGDSNKRFRRRSNGRTMMNFLKLLVLSDHVLLLPLLCLLHDMIITNLFIHVLSAQMRMAKTGPEHPLIIIKMKICYLFVYWSPRCNQLSLIMAGSRYVQIDKALYYAPWWFSTKLKNQWGRTSTKHELKQRRRYFHTKCYTVWIDGTDPSADLSVDCRATAQQSTTAHPGCCYYDSKS